MARVDLPALVEYITGTPGRHSGGRWYFYCPNPAHTDAHASFKVHYYGGKWRWKCWSQCDQQGDALSLLTWLKGYTVAQAADYLRTFTGTPDHYTGHSAGTSRANTLPTTYTPAPKPAPTPVVDTSTRPEPKVGAHMLLRYMESRNWPHHVAQHFQLETVIGDRGELRIRHPYFMPTADGGVQLVGWQDRATGTERDKWKTPAGVSLPLFNMPSLQDDTVRTAIICEGPADTITASAALLLDPTIAVVGMPGSGGWRPEYAPLFAGLVVLVATDGDAAGDKYAATIAGDLAPVALRVFRYRPNRGDLTDTLAALGGDWNALRESLGRAFQHAYTVGHDMEPVIAATEAIDPSWSKYAQTLRRIFPPGANPAAPREVGSATVAPLVPVEDNDALAYAPNTCTVCRCRRTEWGVTICTTCDDAASRGRHKWCVCDECERHALTSDGKRCYITPGCTGTYRAETFVRSVPA